MDKLISVVIPAYNVEAYMDKCLGSVLSQTYKNLEVIVVDDGSTDSTADVLAKYAGDSRLLCVRQQNAGVSAARNKGIALASGEYITFVDSDDYLEKDMYEQLSAAMNANHSDMAVCNYNLVYDDRTQKQYSNMHNETIDVTSDIYTYFCKYCACAKPNNYIWTRLYKTNIVKQSGIQFENYKLGDDTLFNFKLLPHIHKVTFIADGLYNYYQRPNSNVYTVANKGNLAVVYADTFDALADYYQGNGFTEFLAVLPIHAFTRLRSVFFYSRLCGMEDAAILENIKSGFAGREIYTYLTGAF